MTTELTAAQRAHAREMSHLLAAAEGNDLWQEADGTSVQTDREYFGVSDPIAWVTEECRLAEFAGLLRVGSGAAWELTDAGEAALTELREGQQSFQDKLDRDHAALGGHDGDSAPYRPEVAGA